MKGDVVMTIEKIRKMKKGFDEALAQEQKRLDEKIDSAIAKANRIADIAENADKILTQLDEEFSEKTGLNKLDIKFLLVAVVLQVLRQVIINKIYFYLNSIDTNRELLDHDAKEIKEEHRGGQDEFKDHRYSKGDKVTQGKYKDWLRILYDTVPYDVTKNTKEALGGKGLSGRDHRRRTFGHDPWLGWIFGTANIITDTISLTDFRTFRVYRNDPITGGKKMGVRIGEISAVTPFSESFESIREDKMRLPAAIAAQGLHIASDRYTKKMLPIPLSTILPETLVGKLYDSQWTEFMLVKNVKGALPIGKFATEAMFSIFINMIIGLVHGIFYDPQQCPSRDLYEVRTRKIILYSNMIASSTNAIQAAIRGCCGDASAMNSLDLGGLVVTLYRIMVDTDFIREMRDQYVFGGIEEMVENEMADKQSMVARKVRR